MKLLFLIIIIIEKAQINNFGSMNVCGQNQFEIFKVSLLLIAAKKYYLTIWLPSHDFKILLIFYFCT